MKQQQNLPVPTKGKNYNGQMVTSEFRVARSLLDHSRVCIINTDDRVPNVVNNSLGLFCFENINRVEIIGDNIINIL